MKNLVAGAFMAGALAFVSFAVYTQTRPAPLSAEELFWAREEMAEKAMGLGDPVIMRQLRAEKLRDIRECGGDWTDLHTLHGEMFACVQAKMHTDY
jgi:hypothetical protein